MNVPSDRRYLPSHEWHRKEGAECVIGISQFAADELTDVTYVSLPKVGKQLRAGQPFGEIESVKATSDLNCGVTGTVTAVNEKLGGSPELVNTDPYDGGWMIRVKLDDDAEYQALLDSAAYESQLKH